MRGGSSQRRKKKCVFKTERIAEALVEIISRVGVPDDMLTDCGSQFTSEVMKEAARLLSLQKLMTWVYHI